MRTVVTIAVDSYDAHGNITGSLLGARCSKVDHNMHDVLDHVMQHLPPDWSQPTFEEITDHLAKARSLNSDPWEQLSIF